MRKYLERDEEKLRREKRRILAKTKNKYKPKVKTEDDETYDT